MDVSGPRHSSAGGGATTAAPPPPGLHPGSKAVSGAGGSGGGATDQAAQAAASLQLLLREDRLLQRHGLTVSGSSNPDTAAFQYAAALLQEDGDSSDGTATSRSTQQRANVALQDVERKLALVESLAVKLSRTSPEAVAGHLLRLHGYHLPKDQHHTRRAAPPAPASSEEDGSAADSKTATRGVARTPSMATTTTLVAVRDRADRLERQAEVLENVARRVESSLSRGLSRMEAACTRLERVLTLSSSLKMILRLQFENSKLQNYDLDDVRDLIRAAASVAVLEDLLDRPELRQQVPARIAVVERLRPQAEQTAAAVRRSAAALLEEQYSQPTAVLQQLGATLQVYYHLGELPDAVWKAVDHAHDRAESVSRKLFNAVHLANMTEQAKKLAAASSSVGGGSGGGGSRESRSVQKKLRQVRADAAQEWAVAIGEVAVHVRSLHRVLSRKTDPVRRQVFIDVVANAPVPTAYGHTSGDNKRNDKLSSSKRGGSSCAAADFNLFSLFWGRLCRSLAGVLEGILEHDHGRLRGDVAALYPAVRAAALEMIGSLQDTLPTAAFEDAGAAPMAGVLGGSAVLDDAFLDWKTGQWGGTGEGGDLGGAGAAGDNPQAGTAAYSAASADSWTQASAAATTTNVGQRLSQRLSASSLSGMGGNAAAVASGIQSAASVSAVCQSTEWKALQGNNEDGEGGADGLYPLQRAFLDACSSRLQEPLQYMFPDNDVTIDDDGGTAAAATGGLSLLPSKYDVQRFDENIRQELSLADPREGGGDLTAVTMIAECVVSMICQFCQRARNAVSGAGEDRYLADDWSMTESLLHDRKVAAIMHTMANYLRTAPEKTFVAPYRPATSPQHEQAAAMCQRALAPAVQDVDNMVKGVILSPLCRAINRRIGSVLARMHLGVYLEGGGLGTDEDAAAPAFVQKHMTPVLDAIAGKVLARFPPDYAAVVASAVARYSIYTFVSNASLVRPLGETARLHITQDLADFELALEQFVVRSGSSLSLGHIGNGKPYAELRAVRQLLFWTGLEDGKRPAEEVARNVLRESWMRDDIRPSTVLHYLFSYAPSLLSSPHHAKRMKAEEYVSQLVQLDGAVEDGEDAAWMTVMACCDSYQQRASSAAQPGGGEGAGVAGDGDPRIPHIVMALGPELMRRRRH